MDTTTTTTTLPGIIVRGDLSDWVATKDEETTKVVAPWYIDYRAVNDLYAYHPHPDFLVEYSFQLREIHGSTPRKAKAQNLKGPWEKKFKEAIEGMEFTLETDGKQEYLLAEPSTLSKHKFGTDLWTITSWKIVNGRTSKGEPIKQEIIEWQSEKVDGAGVISTYGWLPYRETVYEEPALS